MGLYGKSYHKPEKTQAMRGNSDRTLELGAVLRRETNQSWFELGMKAETRDYSIARLSGKPHDAEIRIKK